MKLSYSWASCYMLRNYATVRIQQKIYKVWTSTSLFMHRCIYFGIVCMHQYSIYLICIMYSLELYNLAWVFYARVLTAKLSQFVMAVKFNQYKNSSVARSSRWLRSTKVMTSPAPHFEPMWMEGATASDVCMLRRKYRHIVWSMLPDDQLAGALIKGKKCGNHPYCQVNKKRRLHTAATAGVVT